MKKQKKFNTRVVVLLMILAMCIGVAGYVAVVKFQLNHQLANSLIANGRLDMAEIIYRITGVSNYESRLIEEAIRIKRSNFVNRYLADGGNPNLIGSSGLPMVYIAASKGAEVVVRDLASFGANMNHHPISQKSLLILAANRKDLDAARLLLANGCNPNLKSKKGTPIIYHQMRKRNHGLVKVLCENGADLNYRSRKGKTLLDLAYLQGNLEMADYLKSKGVRAEYARVIEAAKRGDASEIRRLIQQGADPHVLDDNDDSPLTIAIYSDHPEAVEAFLAAGVDPNLPHGQPLRTAVEKNRLGQVKKLIVAGADPNCRKYPYDQTALHVAACHGILPIVKLLVAYGVNINAGHIDGFTALEIAERCGNTDIAAYLKANGASWDTGSAWMEEIPPFALAAATGDLTTVADRITSGQPVDALDQFGNNALHHAARAGRTEVMALLIKKSAEPCSNGMLSRTPLFSAARYGQKEACEFLVEKGCRIDAKDNYGYTPLHMAARGNHPETVRFLIAKGAGIESNKKGGGTPLSSAASRNALDVARLLLEKGARIEAKDDWQRTPLHKAVMRSSPEMVQLLIDHGADLKAADKQGVTPLDLGDTYRTTIQGQRVYRMLLKYTGEEFQASFDCTEALDDISLLLCAHPKTAGLDVEMAEKYTALVKRTPARLRRKLKQEQQKWLEQRYDRCRLATAFIPITKENTFWEAQKCLQEDYENRISELTGGK